MRYHYLTLEQREALEQQIRAQLPDSAQRQEALARLHQPGYGECIECGADIGFARLLADPYALHCRACARLPVSAAAPTFGNPGRRQPD